VYVLLDLEPLGAEHTLQAGSVIELSVRAFENVSLLVCGRTSEKQKGSSKLGVQDLLEILGMLVDWHHIPATTSRRSSTM